MGKKIKLKATTRLDWFKGEEIHRAKILNANRELFEQKPKEKQDMGKKLKQIRTVRVDRCKEDETKNKKITDANRELFEGKKKDAGAESESAAWNWSEVTFEDGEGRVKGESGAEPEGERKLSPPDPQKVKHLLSEEGREEFRNACEEVRKGFLYTMSLDAMKALAEHKGEPTSSRRLGARRLEASRKSFNLNCALNN